MKGKKGSKAAAHNPVAAGCELGERLPPADFLWLMQLLRLTRPDLAQGFPIDREVDLELARWLLTSGMDEYRALNESEGFKKIFASHLNLLNLPPLALLIHHERKDVAAAFPLPAKKAEFEEWFYRHGIDEHKLFRYLDHEARVRYRQAHPEQDAPAPRAEPGADFPFGANLIGYAYGQAGVAEVLRTSALAIMGTGAPFTIVNFPPGPGMHQHEMDMAAHVSDAPIYKYNIFSMSVPELGRCFLENGRKVFEGRYNIGYLPWEFAQWPTDWEHSLALLDEIWVYSSHVYNALAPVSPVPVLIMPPPVDTCRSAPMTRADFNLPNDQYLFCFSFDFNSSIHRKNPLACLKAFERAFPDRGNKCAGLVIKAHKSRPGNRDWNVLKELAQKDKRIRIVEKDMPKPELLALYKSCDCFLSLHRAEGFGLGIAEALELGLRVIATGYSGNVDFCRGHPNVYLSDYSLKTVEKGQYPFAEGQEWAEPDIKHAARLMRQAVAERKTDPPRRLVPLSLQTAGKRFVERLRVLWQWRLAMDSRRPDSW